MILHFWKNGLSQVQKGIKNSKIVKNIKIDWDDLAVRVKLNSFISQEGGIAEYHAMVQYTNHCSCAEVQYANVEKAILRLQQQDELKNSKLVFRRYFVSDAVNQKEFLNNKQGEQAVSIVQQPPLDGTKVAVWLYFVENIQLKIDESGTVIMESSSYKHLYNTQLHNPVKNEDLETRFIFDRLIQSLSQHQCTLKDNCIRTWIYVQGVDVHYADMVKARVDIFNQEGLTNKTHYIASTGIEGRYLIPQSLVLMDAYSVKGIKQNQILYLYGATHLNPTYEYGVTFERGTAIDYGDRRHIFISGTASINNKGEIMFPTNILKQADRTFENVQVLLVEAEADMTDVAQMIVYLRDTADYHLIAEYVEKHYSDIPYVIVWAPVCRPGWLIEVECIAIKSIKDSCFDKF